MSPIPLPSDFEWGFATAAYQIEGAVDGDGRGKSIWDTFCHLEPTRTKGASGDIACDHYHRFQEDFDLLSRYGAKSYRFSISWSRIIPLGGRNDPLNEFGIDFYHRLIDSLLARGIIPWVTLYHWDLPQALHDRYGGWLNVEESQLDFERYAKVCYERFGDRVKNWITLNEPWIVSIFGYATGGNAPGRSSINPQSTEGNTATEPWIVGKSLIMSHARAVALYNREFRAIQRGKIGISLNGDYYEPWDSQDERDKLAAERRMEFHIGWFANPVCLAQDYPVCMREQLGDRLPMFTQAEMHLLQQADMDFYGMNYYTSQFARHRDEPASENDFLGNVEEFQEDKQGVSVGEPSGVHWLRSTPSLFRKHLTRVYRKYGKPIYITENGCPCPGEDKMACEEAVEDNYRVRYFQDHVDAVGLACNEDGSDIRGYFAWSLMDNLEWSDGYGVRFGVTFTDYDTLARTPKKSALQLKGMFDERIGALPALPDLEHRPERVIDADGEKQRRGPKTKRHKFTSEAHPSCLDSPTAPSLDLSGRSPNTGLCITPTAAAISLDAWGSSLTAVDPALSPETAHTVRTSISEAASARAISAVQRWQDLAHALYSRDPSANLERTVNHSFELFFQYLFPLIPLVHEPSLRDGLNFFVARRDNTTANSLMYGLNSLKYPELWPDVTFTLITAVCAEAAFLLPKSIFPEGESIAEIFLEASRNCLITYLESDLEYPNANSVAIRYFHSNCMHAAGKPRLSWHIFGEATRLAQVMQMHEEESLQGLSPLEAEFRRRAFWIVYIGDKSAAILNNRPITIHKFSFNSGITIGYPTGIEDENSFIAGFNANIRLWESASDLLLEMRLIDQSKTVNGVARSAPTAEERYRLDHLYVLFATSLDNLPSLLQPDKLVMNVGEESSRLSSLMRQCGIQAANLYVSLHCLKMVITQKLEEFNHYPPTRNDILLLRKTDIARDMLRVICDAPFWTLQVNGEPCVSLLPHTP
ncbi:uncharacterized protein N7477_009995 [Penicillium maclennaniae]|uniref:uncharacterized protein n=1 Tax=Penicillium maclennaniae TaxID=1343394 RepID=UPI00253FA350|nr:uncharacterized protein N7477_009995 [Penicillium maclennaniae]KAJ5662379.1 hypothetical protein N7477_009995 [Penicillium maclennaniae]